MSCACGGKKRISGVRREAPNGRDADMAGSEKGGSAIAIGNKAASAVLVAWSEK